MVAQLYNQNGVVLRYYEIKNDRPPLVLLHAQGVDALSFARVMPRLAKGFHVYSVDCYGHGGSLHDPARYNIVDMGRALDAFMGHVVGRKAWLLGHSSGGLIAAYVAAETDWCQGLILEDPPFFACQGERRKQTFNYIDLSTLCHDYLAEAAPRAEAARQDFVLYHFQNQQAWQFFPDQNREKIRQKLVRAAEKHRRKHPHRDLWVPFWPKAALSAYRGMNAYDPRFGLTFYDDSFHCGIPHADLLGKIRCPTVFMKAKTQVSDAGILLAALDEDDTARVAGLVEGCRVVRFDCGHGIHIEKPGAFVRCVLDCSP